MPVKGLIPQLMEVGKIKIGKKGEWKESTGGKRFQVPKKLDHFILTTVERDEDGQFVEDQELMQLLKDNKALHKNKDGNLTELPIRLLFDDIDLNFPTRYAAYYGAKCVCSGDGTVAHDRDGNKRECPCQQLEPSYSGKDKCKVNGVLSVILDGTQMLGGCHKFRTTSVNTCKNILGSLVFLKAASGGALAFLPLKLVLRPKTVLIPSDGSTSTVYVASVIFSGTDQEFMQKSLESARQRADYQIKIEQVEEEARRLLLADSESEEDIAREFYPGAQEEPPKSEPPKEEPPKEEPPKDETKGEPEPSTEEHPKGAPEKEEPAKEEPPKEEPPKEEPAAETPTEDVPPPADPAKKEAMAEQSDFEKLIELKSQLRLDTDTWIELLVPYKVRTAKSMTKVQVKHFIGKLDSMLPTDAQDG